jgi:hypothetical protein
MNRVTAAPTLRPLCFAVLSVIAISVLSAGLCLVNADEGIFKGEIADSQCAMNVHSLSRSHKEMLETKSAGQTAADCTVYCVKQKGGKFVLQIKNKVYRLDNQDLVQPFAGRKVRVTGDLQADGETIHVRTIDPLD